MSAPLLPRRLRKLAGLIIILVYLPVYALAAMSLAVRILPDQWAVQLVYYGIAGFLWIIPMKPLIYWMERSDPQP
jgi:hypothetical protein